MTNGWPDDTRPGVPINPERDGWHWIRRKGSQWHEAWRWDPDADGCGTEYSGAWAEADGDGVPIEMARWYEYVGPCLTPAEVEAARDDAWKNAVSVVQAAYDVESACPETIGMIDRAMQNARGAA